MLSSVSIGRAARSWFLGRLKQGQCSILCVQLSGSPQWGQSGWLNQAGRLCVLAAIMRVSRCLGPELDHRERAREDMIYNINIMT